MLKFVGDGKLSVIAKQLLETLMEFGAMDALPRTSIEAHLEVDPEDDEESMDASLQPASPSPSVTVRQIPMGKGLPAEFQERLRQLVIAFPDVLLAPSPASVPREVVEHRITFRDDVYVSARPFRCGAAQMELLRKHISDLLRAGMIRRSNSPHSSAIFSIPKKDGELRWVVDFRQVNSNTVPDRYPIPCIEDLLPRIRNASVFSRIDLKSAYWQVGIRQEDQEKTAFVTPFGLYEWRVLAFGLTNAPACFQRLIDRVLADCRESAIGYFDDILVYSTDLEAHVCHLREVFRRLAKYGLRINAKKCLLAAKSVLFLGYVISEGRLRPDPSKVEAISKFGAPRTVKELQRFLGMVGFYRRWIHNFSATAAPLTQLTKKGSPFRWGPEQQKSFEVLRSKLQQGPILALPDARREFILETDASITGIGGVLSQDFEEGRLPIAFASRTLVAAEKKYPTRELECLAILYCCKRFAPYLRGRRFRVFTDHASLTWLSEWKSPPPRILRWLSTLQQFSMDVIYRPGKQNVVADALSRVSVIQVDERVEFPEEAEWAQAYAEDPMFGPFIAFLEGTLAATSAQRVTFDRMAQRFRRE